MMLACSIILLCPYFSVKPAGLSDFIAGFPMAKITANDGLGASILVVEPMQGEKNVLYLSFIMLSNGFESNMLFGTIWQWRMPCWQIIP